MCETNRRIPALPSGWQFAVLTNDRLVNRYLHARTDLSKVIVAQLVLVVPAVRAQETALGDAEI